MGVLLYALLCGFLPFDDENISNLYRKIQAGVYEKPSWLSSGSLQLLHAMLQTDPKRRITVQELLTHPWLLEGYEKPVRWQSRYSRHLYCGHRTLPCWAGTGLRCWTRVLWVYCRSTSGSPDRSRQSRWSQALLLG